MAIHILLPRLRHYHSEPQYIAMVDYPPSLSSCHTDQEILYSTLYNEAWWNNASRRADKTETIITIEQYVWPDAAI